MDSVENDALPELNKRVSCIFADFMTKFTKLDEMVSIANNILVEFHQQLEFLRKPALNKTSEVVDNILKANETERVKAYVQSRCRNVHDSTLNINKLNACERGLQDHLINAKDLLNEVEMLTEDLISVVRILSQCQDEHTLDGKEEMESTPLRKPQVSDYAAMMGIIYNMLTQDYTMQEKIISSLSLNSSSGELESYCLMWSLRPFINDEIMQQAWGYIL